MRVAGYDYAEFCRGVAGLHGSECWVRGVLLARRARMIEAWRQGDPGGESRADWIPGPLLTCDGPMDGHHVLSKSWLKSWWATEQRVIGPRDLEGNPVVDQDFVLGEVLNDPRNGVPACRRHHDLLEVARIVLCRGELPEQVEEFAAELGDRVVARLERDYVGVAA